MNSEENKRLPRNKSLKTLSSNLRNNATPQENKLWYEFLRTYPVRFNRQRIVGNFILDFYCAKARLAVELDGSQHYENKGINHDEQRTEYLESLGIYVLRFTNSEINENFYEVCTVIDETVKCRMK
ncbi:MAG: endonuclease domain-containing protein [Clostridia bacterium]|nr:endonuclease domain-containing protein [Clostridia bacterium]